VNLKAHTHRRQFLRTSSTWAVALSVVTWLPKSALAAWNKAAFEAKSVAAVYKALGIDGATASADVQVLASDIAENGAVVPVTAVSKIPNTTQISFLVENNPTTMTAQFDLMPGVLPEVSTRLKLAKTTKVIAVVQANGKYYTAAKEIKVTLGGCGG
jgi:sulfur-oxidizing protein SoxY